MPLLVEVRSFLRNLFSSRRVDGDLDREIHSHLEMLIDENIRAGMPLKEAQRAARIELGGTEQVKEQVRQERMGSWLHSVISDCRYGLRQLRKNPGFTAVVVLTLALGIGANTAIFSMVNALLLHPYNFRNLDSLVRVWEDRGIDEGFDARYLAPADAEDLRAEQQVFEKLTTYRMQSFGMGAGPDIQPVLGCGVSADFFDVLGVRPAAGRLFIASEEQPG